MSYPENYIKQLQQLLQIVNDSCLGYKEAVKDAGSPELKDLFNNIASERETLASQLKERISRYGSDLTTVSTDILGALHRGWMDVKTSLTHKTDQTVLESCRNGDQVALDVYDDILQGDLLNDTGIKTFLMEQRYIINRAYMDLDARYFSLFKKDPSI